MKININLFAIGIILILSAGCKKEFDYSKTGSAHVGFVHAVPGTRGVNILANDQVLMAGLGYLGTSPGLYKAVNSGTVNVSVFDTTRRINVINNAPVTLQSGTNYSVFAYDTLNAGSVKALVLTDDLTTPASGTAHLRFLHLSPNAPNVDVWALWPGATAGTTDSVRLAQNVPYIGGTTPDASALSKFSPVPSRRYTVRVRVSASGAQVLNLTNIDLGSGKIYTVYARGLVGVAATPLGASIIINN
jgi:hypothetical protein